MILFTQPTAFTQKKLNDEIKLLCSLHFFAEAAQNSLAVPRVFHVQRNPRVFQVCGHPHRICWPDERRDKKRHSIVVRRLQVVVV